jgi:hypothetical protein
LQVAPIPLRGAPRAAPNPRGPRSCTTRPPLLPHPSWRPPPLANTRHLRPARQPATAWTVASASKTPAAGIPDGLDPGRPSTTPSTAAGHPLRLPMLPLFILLKSQRPTVPCVSSTAQSLPPSARPRPVRAVRGDEGRREGRWPRWLL